MLLPLFAYAENSISLNEMTGSVAANNITDSIVVVNTAIPNIPKTPEINREKVRDYIKRYVHDEEIHLQSYLHSAFRNPVTEKSIIFVVISDLIHASRVEPAHTVILEYVYFDNQWNLIDKIDFALGSDGTFEGEIEPFMFKRGVYGLHVTSSYGGQGRFYNTSFFYYKNGNQFSELGSFTKDAIWDHTSTHGSEWSSEIGYPKFSNLKGIDYTDICFDRKGKEYDYSRCEDGYAPVNNYDECIDVKKIEDYSCYKFDGERYLFP